MKDGRTNILTMADLIAQEGSPQIQGQCSLKGATVSFCHFWKNQKWSVTTFFVRNQISPPLQILIPLKGEKHTMLNPDVRHFMSGCSLWRCSDDGIIGVLILQSQLRVILKYFMNICLQGDLTEFYRGICCLIVILLRKKNISQTAYKIITFPVVIKPCRTTLYLKEFDTKEEDATLTYSSSCSSVLPFFPWHEKIFALRVWRLSPARLLRCGARDGRGVHG